MLVDRLAGQGTAGAPGVAAAAEPVRRARRAARPGRRRPGARAGVRQPRAARRAAGAGRRSSTSRSSSAATCCGCDLAGAAGHVGVVGGTAERQVDRAAHADLRARADPHPGRGAGLLPRLRRRRAGSACGTCRTSAGSPAGWTRPRSAARSARSPRCSPTGSGASPSSASTRWPPTGGAAPPSRRPRAGDAVRRRVPGRRRLGRRCASEYEDLEPVDHRHRHPRPVLRHPRGGAASRWMDFRPAIRDLFGSRLELRLGDPSDSVVNRRAAANVPEEPPGRGHHRRRAAPAHRAAGAEPAATTADLVKAVAAAWTGPAAPRVRLLPAARAVRAMLRRRPPAAGAATCRSASPRPTCSPVRRRLRRRAALAGLRRRRVRQVVVPAGLATTITRPVHARSRPGSSSSTTGAACSAPSRTEHLIGYGTAARSRPTDLIASVAGYMQRRLPGPGRHPGAAARPLLVDRAGVLRAGRRLRPGRRRARPTRSTPLLPLPAPRPATSACT